MTNPSPITPVTTMRLLIIAISGVQRSREARMLNGFSLMLSGRSGIIRVARQSWYPSGISDANAIAKPVAPMMITS